MEQAARCFVCEAARATDSALRSRGCGAAAHGSAVMPTWGFIFRYLDKQNEAAVRQRITDLFNYSVFI